MEKPDAPQLPLTILHHDEHILFPGYDAMVGNGGSGYHEKNGPSTWTAGNFEDRADLSDHGRDGIHRSCILLAFVGLVAYISAHPSPEARTAASFEGIATFNDYSSQLETQGSTVCGGNGIPGWSNIEGGSILELSVVEGFLTGGQR
ncbi:MAG: hypothetical protein LQ350_003584 [Teloschistes chrysophthalmus]|nr:MAG: hypothetical protein LQ350_003584 [Niorma chrysophthalma]